MTRNSLLIFSGVVAVLLAALLLWPRLPPTRDHLALVSLVMSGPRDELAALCRAGKPFTNSALRAAGLAPRFRPTVLEQKMGSRDGKNVVVAEKRVPAREINEATVRIEASNRLILTLTLPEVRSGFKTFDSVSIPEGSKITLIAECKEKTIKWSTDRKSTTVPDQYLVSWMRDGLR